MEIQTKELIIAYRVSIVAKNVVLTWFLYMSWPTWYNVHKI